MINGGEVFSCNGLIPVKSSCIGIIPVKELGPGGHVFPGRSSLRAVFTCISASYQVQNIFVNCSRVHMKKRNQRQIAFSITWTRQEPCGLVGSSVISDPGLGVPGSRSTLHFCVAFFLKVRTAKKFKVFHMNGDGLRTCAPVKSIKTSQQVFIGFKDLPAGYYRDLKTSGQNMCSNGRLAIETSIKNLKPIHTHWELAKQGKSLRWNDHRRFQEGLLLTGNISPRQLQEGWEKCTVGKRLETKFINISCRLWVWIYILIKSWLSFTLQV